MAKQKIVYIVLRGIENSKGTRYEMGDFVTEAQMKKAFSQKTVKHWVKTGKLETAVEVSNGDG